MEKTQNCMIQEVKSISHIAYSVVSVLHKLFIQINLAEVCDTVCLFIKHNSLSFLPGGLCESSDRCIAVRIDSD